MHKPYQTAPLSEHHLRIGLLVDFANAVNRGLSRKEMNPMGATYVFDDRAEIINPKNCPENWPTGLIRIYREEKRSDESHPFTLNQFEPAVNAAGYEARYGGGSMDQQGLRFMSSTRYMGLTAHYLAIPEFEQLSFIPLIGEYTDSVDEVMAKVENLTPYDRSQILEVYESSCIKDPYDEETLETLNGVPHTYHNWLFLNACIISRIVTMRQLALAEHAEDVSREHGIGEPITHSEEEPVVTEADRQRYIEAGFTESEVDALIAKSSAAADTH